MSRRELIDPESRPGLEAYLQALPDGYRAMDIADRRVVSARLRQARQFPPHPGVTWEDRAVPGPGGAGTGRSAGHLSADLPAAG